MEQHGKKNRFPQLLSSSPSFVQRDSDLEWEEATKFEIARDLWRKFAQDLTIDRREFSWLVGQEGRGPQETKPQRTEGEEDYRRSCTTVSERSRARDVRGGRRSTLRPRHWPLRSGARFAERARLPSKETAACRTRHYASATPTIDVVNLSFLRPRGRVPSFVRHKPVYSRSNQWEFIITLFVPRRSRTTSRV